MSVEDIIQASFYNNPVGVDQAFNDAIKDKLMNALAARREQMSMSMYGDTDDENEDLDNSDTEEYEDEDA